MEKQKIIKCNCGIKYDFKDEKNHKKSRQHRCYNAEQVAIKHMMQLDILEDLPDDKVKEALLKIKNVSQILLMRLKNLE